MEADQHAAENLLVDDEGEVKNFIDHKTLRFSIDDNKLEEDLTPSVNSLAGSDRYSFLSKWRSSREAWYVL